jgi:hypothetical protein
MKSVPGAEDTRRGMVQRAAWAIVQLPAIRAHSDPDARRGPNRTPAGARTGPPPGPEPGPRRARRTVRGPAVKTASHSPQTADSNRTENH